VSGEQMLAVGGGELCVQTFGDRRDPAVLLVHGHSSSMLWWEEELCRRIAAGGRLAIRYDQRDTGRSTAYPVGRPGYSLDDLADDTVGILDALGIERAHYVGVSMGGGVISLAAMHHPDRVASLTMVTTTTGDPDLPPPTLRAPGGPPDPEDPDAVVEHVVALARAYSGPSRWWDEAAIRRIVQAEVGRARSVAATLSNHSAIDLGTPTPGGFADIRAPGLVVHGERDPLFPLEHGRALQRALPGSRLVVLPGAGHELPRPLWDLFVAELLAHTART
jgi:pimeloyl-ACP methyl ester carboxylesterase